MSVSLIQQGPSGRAIPKRLHTQHLTLSLAMDQQTIASYNRSWSEVLHRRRVGLATTSGSGGAITAGRGEAVPWGDSSTGITVARRAPSSPRLAYCLSAFIMGLLSARYSN